MKTTINMIQYKSPLPEIEIKYRSGSIKKVKIKSSKDAFDILLYMYNADTLEYIEFKKDQGYNVERIIISLLGDIMESYTMHGSESSLSCEFGNPRQIYSAIKVLFDEIFLPIAMTGIKIDVPSVAGNHDRTEVNRTFNIYANCHTSDTGGNRFRFFENSHSQN